MNLISGFLFVSETKCTNLVFGLLLFDKALCIALLCRMQS